MREWLFIFNLIFIVVYTMQSATNDDIYINLQRAQQNIKIRLGCLNAKLEQLNPDDKAEFELLKKAFAGVSMDHQIIAYISYNNDYLPLHNRLLKLENKVGTRGRQISIDLDTEDFIKDSRYCIQNNGAEKQSTVTTKYFLPVAAASAGLFGITAGSVWYFFKYKKQQVVTQKKNKKKNTSTVILPIAVAVREHS